MLMSQARTLKIKDLVIALKGGISGSVEYKPGDVGEIVETADGFFRVQLKRNGAFTRFVDPEKWEIVSTPTEINKTIDDRSQSVDVASLSGAEYWRAVFGK